MAVVAVANVKGGAGKSTTVFNLHEQLGARIVVDGDLHQGISMTNRFRDEPYPNIVHIKGVDDLVKIIESDKKDSIILVDCGGFDDEITSVAIGNCDMLIIPSNADILEEIKLITMSQRLNDISAQVGRKIEGHVLLNRVHHMRTKFPSFDDMISRIDNLTRIPVTIPFNTGFDNPMRQGSAIKSGVIPVRYHHLAKYVKNHLISVGALKHD